MLVLLRFTRGCSDLLKAVETACPDGVQDHVEHIVLLRSVMPDEVLPDFPQPGLHGPVMAGRNPHQNTLQVGDLTLRNGHGESIPVEHIAEGEHKMVRHDHRHAVVVDGLHDARAVDLVPHRTDAIPAQLHVLHVRDVAGDGLREHLVDLHVWVLALPVAQQHGPHSAVHLPREERQVGALVVARSTQLQRQRRLRVMDVHFRQRRIFPQHEPVAQIRVAHHFHCVPSQRGMISRGCWPLHTPNVPSIPKALIIGRTKPCEIERGEFTDEGMCPGLLTQSWQETKK